MEFKTNNVNDTEMVYSLLREKYPKRQIEVEYNDNNSEYKLTLTNEEYIEDPEVPLDLKVTIVYGDSCVGNSSLLLKKNGLVYVETIQSIFDETKKVEYAGFKMFDKEILLEKEYSTTDYQVWTDLGWQDIKKVIRHRCDKKIYKILTHTGCVKVTEDHSLISDNLESIKPLNCNLDTKLLNSYPKEFTSTINTISKDRAFIYGYLMGDKSLERYKCPINGIKYVFFSDNNNDVAFENVAVLFEKEYPNKSFIYDRSKFYDIDDIHKKVHTEILNSSNEIIQSYFDGFFSINKGKCFDVKGQIGAAGMYYLMKKMGYNVSLNTINNKENMFRLSVTTGKHKKIANKIKKIELQELQQELQENNFVYDLETECGRFQAGVGDIIIFNTDSIFLSMKYNRVDFKKNREDSFKLASICGDNLTDIFNRYPVELEFEKVFQPFILITKKRYIGKKFEDTRDPFKLKEVTKSGIATTRRDYCKMVQNCYTEVINCIVDTGNENGVSESIEIYKKCIDKIDAYQIPVEELIISGQLAKNYSCSNCGIKCEWTHLKCDNIKCKTVCLPGLKECSKCKRPFKCVHTFKTASVNLAVKMLQRNEEANVNDRIPYLFIENEKTDKTVELSEDPVYFKNNKLKYNRGYYVKSLAKPLLGFFKIVLNDNKDLLNELVTFTNDKLEEYQYKKLIASEFIIKET